MRHAKGYKGVFTRLVLDKELIDELIKIFPEENKQELSDLLKEFDGSACTLTIMTRGWKPQPEITSRADIKEFWP